MIEQNFKTLNELITTYQKGKYFLKQLKNNISLTMKKYLF